MSPGTSIACPHCGAPNGLEYRPNCFICPHCDSKYRWIDSHQLAIKVEPAVCFCGTNSVGACTLCKTPVCDLHQTTVGNTLRSWQFLRRIYAEFDSRIPKYAEQTLPKNLKWKRAAPGWLFEKNGLARIYEVRTLKVFVSGPFSEEFLTPLLEKMGWGKQPFCSLLCLSCTEEFFITLGPLFDAQAGRFARERRFCEVCLKARQQDDPEKCNDAIPELAVAGCKACGKRLCEDHQRNCAGCGDELCRADHSRLCAECSRRPWRWFQ